ncbi:TIGR04283 family arsenosugar biosynthesis glycosyltransferase [Neptunomonas qingdaonensis]|uniref:Transferase 2, rSAM/selenodomain-associated n=1 Tax=Neptunomonas qingdaonensis TaxID=1045558 RepID=A0A1I2NTK9_9GAMM|nr:TIGR04283 family arsenosugar biosynthesis glycosyltransferase [Neptunomonas qingdaonensis]SFG07202.1 transferase 2, rSAM/selenodomain-associated [Neptunomonas qingdaonensis]
MSASPTPVVSIIIPTLDEARIIVAKLQALQYLRPQCELIIVDGGSRDASMELARGWVDKLVESPAGRAKQMNAGVQASSAELLLFLHLDTDVPANLMELLPIQRDVYDYWGRFDVTIDGQHRMLPIVAFFMNMRSRITGIATGDQGIFVSRSLFNKVGGFPDQPLMEDIEISRRLLSEVRPVCIRQKVVTSGRRWEQKGAIRTIVLMWSLRWAYWCGEAPDKLAERYGYRVGKNNK